MMEYADSLKNQYGAGIEIALDKKVRSLKPDMKTRHEAFLIFKEALRMIVQYAGGKHTLVHIDLFKHKLSIKLHDSTATLDSNTPDIEQSIRDMHNRASHIGADLDIQHESDGVTIILLVPLL
jgi:glucose-6-phosphate-specific signal transduction histidine kinase